MIKIKKSAQLSKRAVYQIQATLHEGAVAISGETVVQGKSFDDCQTVIQEAFATFNKWIADCDGIVGHLKSFISSTEQKAMVSTTGDQVVSCIQPAEESLKEGEQKALISVALIVFNIPQMELEEKLISLFDQLSLESKKGGINNA